jgi:hypothetical protein
MVRSPRSVETLVLWTKLQDVKTLLNCECIVVVRRSHSNDRRPISIKVFLHLPRPQLPDFGRTLAFGWITQGQFDNSRHQPLRRRSGWPLLVHSWNVLKNEVVTPGCDRQKGLSLANSAEVRGNGWVIKLVRDLQFDINQGNVTMNPWRRRAAIRTAAASRVTRCIRVNDGQVADASNTKIIDINIKTGRLW